jgi:hypothetical protein
MLNPSPFGPLGWPSDTSEIGEDVLDELSVSGSSASSEDGEAYSDSGINQLCRVPPVIWIGWLHAGKVGLGMIGCGGEVGVGIGVGIGAGLTDGHVEDEELGVPG